MATAARRQPGHGNGAAPAPDGTGRDGTGGQGGRRAEARASGLLSGTATPQPSPGGPRLPSGGSCGRCGTLWCGLSSQAEAEETLSRVRARRGVIETIVINSEGIPVRTTLDNSTTIQYVGLLHQLTMKARHTVRDIDPQNDLTFLRIRSKKHEIMVAPDKDYLPIVIQNPCE